MKWTKEKIDIFYNNNKDKIIRKGKLLNINNIKALGVEFGKWFNAIKSGKYGYIGIRDFKNINNISTGGYKWTKAEIDTFFINNKDKLLKNNLLISYDEIKLLGKEYYNWNQAIVRKYNGAYKNINEFRDFHGINKENYLKWNKEKIDNFFIINKDILVKNNKIIVYKKVKELGKQYYGWYQAINRGKSGYINMDDFKCKQNLVSRTNNIKRTKEEIDKFLLENKDKLIKDNKLVIYKKIKESGKQYRGWYQAINRGKNGYINMDDFKNKKNLENKRVKPLIKKKEIKNSRI